MIVTIKRQDARGGVAFADILNGHRDCSYWQSFEYVAGDGEQDRQTVSHILDSLNYTDDLFDINGKPARRIKWECSCLQKMCGACAMVINGVPGLACSTYVDTKRQKELKIEPLRKFPVVVDLIVDRSIISEYQKMAGLYPGEVKKADAKQYEHQYDVAKCLKCGLCLEICPNYVKDNMKFYGAAFANSAYLMESMSKTRGAEIKKEYRKHFASACSKSLACRDICPQKLPTLSSISYMNR